MIASLKIRYVRFGFARLASLTMLIASAFASLDLQLAAAQSSSQSNSIQFPYQAMIRFDDTEIHSGPADVHYATDSMAQGEIVQVYRHDPGGWCAIRPNEGSFSLIPAAAVEIVGDDIGKITQDNTQAWVGTRLGSVEKPLWQIKLKAGEEVEILGEASWPSPDGNSIVWYQIAPPAGEFRWVALSALNTPPAETQPVANRPRKPKPKQPEQEKDSGFKYVDLDEKNSPASDLAEETNSGFKYVAPAKEARSPQPNAIANSNTPSKSKPRSLIRQNPVRQNPAAAWSQAESGRPRSPAAKENPRLVSSTPKAANAPRPDEQGIDFKFRPIGQTAVNSGSFDSSPADPIRKDSSVVPAAFQEPVSNSQRPWDGNNIHSTSNGSFDNQWQQGRDDIAKRRSQYEARYDEFNSRSQTGPTERYDSNAYRSSSYDSRDLNSHDFGPSNFDSRDSAHREVEDSFGVRMDELPSHPRRSIASPYHSIPGGQQYTTIIENPYPPADRFASLDLMHEPIPHSALAEKLTGRLAKIEEELTNEMLKRPNEWQLADLELNVGQVYSQTTNPVERLQAQRILDKISKCKVIRNGYTKNFQASGEVFGTSVRTLKNSRGGRSSMVDAYGGVGGVGGSGIANVAGATFSPPNNAQPFLQNNVVGSGVNTDFELNTQFDASGWLTELVSEDRNNRPVYVLVNDSGKITHHVAAAPGLNLHRYLKSKVGVVGRRGYNNRMKLDHITADSVDEIQRY